MKKSSGNTSGGCRSGKGNQQQSDFNNAKGEKKSKRREKAQETMSTVNGISREAAKEENRCFTCGEVGHYAKNCPTQNPNHIPVSAI